MPRPDIAQILEGIVDLLKDKLENKKPLSFITSRSIEQQLYHVFDEAICAVESGKMRPEGIFQLMLMMGEIQRTLRMLESKDFDAIVTTESES